ncbi:ovate family protein [Tripterygium wilfordii]|uniref:Transcription repressor n=1 Tax=Tripterygium wilfordii TaxID=458696 RepID=A0A7J7D5Q5_TRIWF|nr:transcription repressor OFP14 [Tripterygium wilfordii]KAF5741687.1 ovate family protein [Tripterygium wilfordii]
MPKNLQKSLQNYISKIKKPNTPNIQSIPSSKNCILSGCKYPKTPSFVINRNQNEDRDKSSNNDDAATLSDVNRFLFENFKSLYITNDEEYFHEEEGHDENGDNQLQRPNEVLFESPRFVITPPNLHESHRFFVTPGTSGSIMEEARSSRATTSNEISSSANSNNAVSDSVHESKEYTMLPDDCIAVVTYSPSPYDDFRRSMQTMVEEKLRHHGKVDWDFMEEILFCYLNLNEKKSHKFILSAFVDLIVVLRQDSKNVGGRSRRTRSPQNARERRRNMR